jgi:hypothetical protein
MNYERQMQIRQFPSFDRRIDHNVIPIVTLVAVLFLLLLPPFGWAAPAQSPAQLIAGAPPVSAYPAVGPGTHFLDRRRLLADMPQPGWYEANIPFLQVPDKTIQNVYYYRWRVWKEHLRTLQPGEGPILTEFLPNVSWANPDNAIDDAAGHHIMDGRWARDSSYLRGYIRYWLLGPGQAHQSTHQYTEKWVNEYSNWIIDAAWQRALVIGRIGWLKQLEPALIRQYKSWSDHLNQRTGLYWQLPLWDAMEYSAASYASGQDFSGVPTLRPTINAYQYAAAKVIARLASMRHEQATARAFAAKARHLKRNVEQLLWAPQQRFFTDILLPRNPRHARLQARQEIGFVPWYFELPDPRYSVAWKQLMDPKGFFTAYGPTTLEVRDQLYMHDAYVPGEYDGNCCHWDGPSWPYATAQTLTALANLLDDYPAQSYVSKADYDKLLHIYALTQMKDGHPYVAEAHAPSRALWIYDERDHSEDYNHSSFVDLIISGLIGLRPQLGNSLAIKPLVPSDWGYFCLENVPYHGHNVTVLYDRNGKHYHQGTGLYVYIDGHEVVSSPELRELTVQFPPPDGRREKTFMDDAVNIAGNGYPHSTASYTSRRGHDSAWHGIDGNIWYDRIPEVNTRWTNADSPSFSDTYGVKFGAAIPIDEVRYYTYCDRRDIAAPAAYRLQYWTGSAWASVPDQRRTPETPTCNDLNRIVFPTLVTGRLRLVVHNQSDRYVGVTELQAGSWASPAAQLRFGPATGQALAAVPSRPMTVTATLTNRDTENEQDIAIHLVLPSGWQAKPISKDGAASLGAGKSLRIAWRIMPAAKARARQVYALWAYASFTRGGKKKYTHARMQVHVLPVHHEGVIHSP